MASNEYMQRFVAMYNAEHSSMHGALSEKLVKIFLKRRGTSFSQSRTCRKKWKKTRRFRLLAFAYPEHLRVHAEPTVLGVAHVAGV